MNNYFYLEDLCGQIGDIPADSIISRTIYQDEEVKAILFGFAPGQELSEHTASTAAIIHILEGETRLKLGEDEFAASAGSWIHMPPQLPHGLYAKTPVRMLLLLLR